MTTTEKVSATTRAIMGEQKKKVSELALLLGVSRQTASLLYNGNQAMTTDQIATIATWLGTTPTTFFSGISYEKIAA